MENKTISKEIIAGAICTLAPILKKCTDLQIQALDTIVEITPKQFNEASTFLTSKKIIKNKLI